MFDLSQYQTVDERIALFWAKYPNGRLNVEIVELKRNEVGQAVQVIMRAEAYKDLNDQFPSAVDFAEETLGSNPVNRTSFIENCATSVIGRCLGTLNFSPKKPTGEAANLRPTQTEMTKAERVSPMPKLSDVVATTAPKPNYSSEHPNPTPAQMANIEKRAKECGVPAAQLNEYLNNILGRDKETRISKRDASELIGLDRETWIDIAQTMGFSS